jgi:hypothetical protein
VPHIGTAVNYIAIKITTTFFSAIRQALSDFNVLKQENDDLKNLRNLLKHQLDNSNARLGVLEETLKLKDSVETLDRVPKTPKHRPYAETIELPGVEDPEPRLRTFSNVEKREAAEIKSDLQKHVAELNSFQERAFVSRGSFTNQLGKTQGLRTPSSTSKATTADIRGSVSGRQAKPSPNEGKIEQNYPCI